jgi:hypothetical protein
MTAIEEAAKRLPLTLPGRRPGPAFPLPQGPSLPGARPPLVPGPRGGGRGQGGLQECAYLPQAARYDLELSPGWNPVYYEPEDPGIHRAWVYGRKEAYWKVWAR